MFSQNGSKTARVNTSSKRRDSSLKQPHTGSFGTLDDDYFQNNLKSPKSSVLQNQLSARKIAIAPNTTKHSNEYYFKAQEEASPANTRKKIAIKNPSMNINTEFQITNESVHEKNKAVTTRELKIKTSGKTNYGMESNPNLDLASIDQALKAGGPNSAASPKSKIYRELSVQKQNSKATEYYASSSSSNTKNPINSHVEGSPELKAASPEADGVSTLSNSNHRPSTRQDPNWNGLKLPVDPQFVLDNFGSYLSPYEKEEITKYTQIYYISDIYHKILARGEQEYEDERGDYLVVKNDHIRFRYEALEMLGRGSFGQVLKVYDHKRKEYAAIKVIRSPKKFHFQAKIEIRVLKYMMENYGADYNIVGLRDYFLFRNHVCLVFDLMDVNLYDLLKKNKFKGFPLSTVRKFAIQVLYALKFLNHHKIVHCDLKPENILLKHPNKTGIKLIDFGSSCFENEKLYTYIQSRFYRSPEVILGLQYNTQIDMWSFGCLLCELYLGYPIFAGDSERDQLFSMFEVLGVPDREFLETSSRKTKFFDEHFQPLSVANTKGKVRVPNGTPIASYIKPGDETFLDLVRHCLEFDPQKRFTPDQALSHTWIIEGLPPQLQAQHLKFIRDTNQNEGINNYNLYSKAASTHDIRVHQQDDEHHQNSHRAPTSSEKSVANLQIRKIQTQDAKTLENHIETGEDTTSPMSAQKKFFPKKLNLNEVQKEKFTLKAVYKAGSTRNLNQLNSEREIGTPSNKKANLESMHKSQKTMSDLSKIPQKKSENPENFTKGGLVAWESVSHRSGNDEKSSKASIDFSPLKKSLSTLYSPKVSQSVERGLPPKNEKESVFNLTKTSMLPALKHATSQKNK